MMTAATAFFFLLLFGPKLLVGNFDTLGASCAVACFLLWRYTRGALGLPDFWLTLVAMIYILLVLTATGVRDGWWLLKPPRVILNYLGVFAFVTWGLQRFGRPRMLLLLHNTVTAHAVVILLMAAIPVFEYWVVSTVGGVTKSTFQISGLTRGLALSAIVMMFPFVTYPLFSMLHGYRERGIILKLALIAAATLFMGRTGFYMCLAASVVVLAVLGLRSWRSMKLALSALLVIGLVGTDLVRFRVDPGSSIIGAIPGSSSFAEPASHILEPIINYIQGRGLTARSVEHVLSMPIVYHNETLVEKLFGTGLYGRGDALTYLPTDVAYLHMYSAFGAVGIGLFLLSYFAPLMRFAPLRATAPFWALATFVTMVIVANFKETAIFTRNLYTMHVFFVAWLAYDWRQTHRPSAGRMLD